MTVLAHGEEGAVPNERSKALSGGRLSKKVASINKEEKDKASKKTLSNQKPSKEAEPVVEPPWPKIDLTMFKQPSSHSSHGQAMLISLFPDSFLILKFSFFFSMLRQQEGVLLPATLSPKRMMNPHGSHQATPNHRRNVLQQNQLRAFRLS